MRVVMFQLMIIVMRTFMITIRFSMKINCTLKFVIE